MLFCSTSPEAIELRPLIELIFIHPNYKYIMIIQYHEKIS